MLQDGFQSCDFNNLDRVPDGIYLWQIGSSSKDINKFVFLKHEFELIHALYPEQESQKQWKNYLSCFVFWIDSPIFQLVDSLVDVIDIFHVVH